MKKHKELGKLTRQQLREIYAFRYQSKKVKKELKQAAITNPEFNS